MIYNVNSSTLNCCKEIFMIFVYVVHKNHYLTAEIWIYTVGINSSIHTNITCVLHTCIIYYVDCVDDCRATFLENGGCEQLATVLKSYSGLPASADNEKLKCVICGCLSNTCSEQNGIAKLLWVYSSIYVYKKEYHRSSFFKSKYVILIRKYLNKNIFIIYP